MEKTAAGLWDEALYGGIREKSSCFQREVGDDTVAEGLGGQWLWRLLGGAGASARRERAPALGCSTAMTGGEVATARPAQE